MKTIIMGYMVLSGVILGYFGIVENKMNITIVYWGIHTYICIHMVHIYMNIYIYIYTYIWGYKGVIKGKWKTKWKRLQHNKVIRSYSLNS